MEETKTQAPDELLMEQLQNRNWDELWLRLVGRCFWLLRKRYTVKWQNDEITEFARKAIGEVINKIFIEKERRWNIDRYPDFEDFIVGVIDSHVNNTLNKKSDESNIGENNFILDQNAELELNAEDIVISDELRNQVHSDLEAAGAEVDELLIFECLADGLAKPDDIRNDLGMNETDFHNAWRRFKRRRKVIQDKLAAYGY